MHLQRSRVKNRKNGTRLFRDALDPRQDYTHTGRTNARKLAPIR